MTSNDLKITKNDLKMTWKASNEIDKPACKKKTKTKYILRGGHPIGDNSTQGRDFIEQAFFSQKMAKFEEIRKKDSEVRNEITQTIVK